VADVEETDDESTSDDHVAGDPRHDDEVCRRQREGHDDLRGRVGDARGADDRGEDGE
jgi:hypothetical protein